MAMMTPVIAAAKKREISAIAFPLTSTERDHRNALSWTRLGAAPHITPLGFEGNGYDSRYRSTNIPAWMSPATTELTMHCTAAAYQCKHRSTVREAILYAGSNDATANPKLELAVNTDSHDPVLSMFQVRAFTTAAQATWVGRPGWKFEFRFPELLVGANEVRPQFILFLDADTVVVGGHFQDTESRAYKIRISDGALLGSFTFGVGTYTHVSTIAQRSNGDIWVTDYQTFKMLRLDLSASFATGTAVILDVYDTSVLTQLGSIEFLTISGTEYALMGQYATTGTPYVYVVPASLLGTGTFAITDRYKRFDLGLYIQGFTMNAGQLYVSRNQKQGGTVFGGYIQSYDIVSAITTAADGAVLSSPAWWPGPARYMEDIKFHPTTGHLWAPTEGVTAVGSDDIGLSVWSTPLGTRLVENHYTIHFNGASLVTIKINGRLAQTQPWAINRSVVAISVGGLPAATAGMQNGFFAGIVRNVVFQSKAMTDGDYSYAISGGYEPTTLESYPFALVNPGAELGNTTGWTLELGDFQSISEAQSQRDQPEGTHCFYAGNTSQSIAYQRLDLLSQTGWSSDRVNTTGGVHWAGVRWQQTSSNVSDPSACGFRMVSPSATEISLLMGAVVTVPNVAGSPWQWWTRKFHATIPANTQFIDTRLRFDRTVGTSNDGYIDDVSTTVYSRPPTLVFDTSWARPNSYVNNGNRTYVSGPNASALWHKAKGQFVRSPSAGSYYFEVVIDALTASATIAIGIASTGTAVTSASGTTNNAGDGGRYQYFNTGQKRSGGVYSDYGASYTTGDIIGISITAASGNTSVRFYKNGVDQGEAFSIAGVAGNWDPHVCVFANTVADSAQLSFNDTLIYLPVGYVNWAPA